MAGYGELAEAASRVPVLFYTTRSPSVTGRQRGSPGDWGLRTPRSCPCEITAAAFGPEAEAGEPLPDH